MTNLTLSNDDYDSPWKAAIDDYFPEFIAFYFPDIHANIDWQVGYEALDNEFQSIVRDADIGKHRADKLVKVTRMDGIEDFVYIHIEVQSQIDKTFEQRMFTYHYRIYDKYGQHPVSLAVLADESQHWQPNAYKTQIWGSSLNFEFRMVKLLNYSCDLNELQANDNAFAILTAAHILTKRTKKKPQDRFNAKFTLIRLLYQRGWDREEMAKFLRVIDWLMLLPPEFAVQLRERVHNLEEEQQMKYVTSFEQLAMAEGRSGGMIEMFLNMLTMKFPNFDLQAYKDKIINLTDTKLTEYGLRIATAKTPEEVFADDEKK